MTTEGIFEGAEDLYRHNKPKDKWEAPKLTKEYEKKIVHLAQRDENETIQIDWVRLTNFDLV
ncbi:hypothetical protein KR100_13845 [Synechococcus sp. KORDI-100]|uniref:hypothetical protein n=1 Tax=Synechococcus sp. KORDI-100 TaxID=1280380 RepID=UPI0004E0AED3|nr:hypothetical protein [Synechococcus sp. KORDI-100]AII44431.1 hypothetical protein KR100_13845 [Synechococcus sp. KORDI-100]